jgi:hypothetical protein
VSWPGPKYEGSALETLTVSALPSLERQPVPVVVKMTLEAVLVKPDHAEHLPCPGTAKPDPMNVVAFLASQTLRTLSPDQSIGYRFEAY